MKILQLFFLLVTMAELNNWVLSDPHALPGRNRVPMVSQEHPNHQYRIKIPDLHKQIPAGAIIIQRPQVGTQKGRSHGTLTE